MTVDEAMRILRHGWSDESRAMAAQVVDGHIATQAAQIEALTKDAERYRWLRLMDWFNGPLSVLRDPQKFVTRPPLLGLDFPSRDRLDEAIDSAIKAKETKA